MSIPKKGARNIKVEDEYYKWLIRKKATYLQSDYGYGYIHVAIQHTEDSGTVLIVYTDKKHPKDLNTVEISSVTPFDIAKWIINAIKLGWKPKQKGAQFSVKIENGKMVILNKNKLSSLDIPFGDYRGFSTL